MSSNGTDANGRSAISMVEEPTGHRPVGDVAHHHVVLCSTVIHTLPTPVLQRGLAQEMDRRSRDSLMFGEGALPERLVEVSHAQQLTAA